MSPNHSNQPLPHYAFRKPAEWDDLIGLTTSALEPDAPLEAQRPAAIEALEFVRSLDDEAFDTNRYYSLGMAACRVMQAINEEGGRDKFIRYATEGMVAAHQSYCSEKNVRRYDGLYLYELGQRPYVQAIIGKKEYTQLPMATRIASEALSVMRRFYDAPVNEGRINAVLSTDTTLIRVIDASLEGASLVTRIALQRKYEQRMKKGVAHKSVLLSDVANEQTIAELDITKVAAQTAALHLNELQEWEIQRLIQINPRGEVYINPNDIPKKPPYIAGLLVRHQKRLGCPALYVAGAVPFAAQSIPRIIAKTQIALQREAVQYGKTNR